MPADDVTIDAPGLPLFILGYGRSGTSLLWNILNKSDDIALQWENDLLYILLSAGHDLNRAAPADEIVRAVASAAGRKKTTRRFLDQIGFFEDLTTAAEQIAGAATLKHALEALLRKPENTAYWGDKSLTSALAIRPICRSWPAAKFLHIVRDPRDVVCSYFEKKHGVEPSEVGGPGPRLRRLLHFYRHAKRWQYRNRSILDSLNVVRGHNVMTIKYEDLVGDPQSTVRAICEFLGISFDPGMIAPGSSASHITRKRWHRGLMKPITSANLGRFRQIGALPIACVELAAPLMAELGYEREARGRFAARCSCMLMDVYQFLTRRGRKLKGPVLLK